MTSNVYHLRFDPKSLPRDAGELRLYARRFVNDLVGPDPKGVYYSFEQEGQNYLLVITVPDHLTEILKLLEQADIPLSHTEPETPVVGINMIVIPRAFQIHHFGAPVHTSSISNNPELQFNVASALSEHIPTLPPNAANYLNWMETVVDPETNVLTIYWEDPDEMPEPDP